MRRWIAVATMVIASAASCGDDDSIASDETTTTRSTTTTAETTTTPPPTTAQPVVGSVADIAVTEVVFGDHVVLTNLGQGSVSLDGLWLCNRPFYTPLPQSELAPGESIEASASPLGDLPMRVGEVALYRSADFENPEEMLDYVTWGSGGGRIRAAVEVGLWPAADAVQPSGDAIVAPDGGSTSADWAST